MGFVIALWWSWILPFSLDIKNFLFGGLALVLSSDLKFISLFMIYLWETDVSQHAGYCSVSINFDIYLSAGPRNSCDQIVFCKFYGSNFLLFGIKI